MKKVKFILLLLLATMFLSILSACGQQSSIDQPSQSIAPTQQQDNDPSDPGDKNSGEFALDPRANPPGTLPVVNEPVSISIAMTERPNVEDFATNAYTKRITELTGIELEMIFFPSTDAQAKMDLLVGSGDPLPDIMTIGISDNLRRLNYGQAGIIIPLDEYYENLGQAFYARCAEAGLDPELDVLRRVRSPDGKIYGAPFYDWHIPNVLSLRAWINKTWLDRLGLDVPKTSEDLIEVLKAFRDNDPNGNGKADEIPMIGFEEGWHSSALDYIMNMFIYSDDNNYYLPFTETGGVVDVAYDKPEYKEYLRYTNSLIKEGLLSPLSITQDNAQYDALLSSDPPVLGIAVSANFHLLSASTDNYVPLEAMQGPEGVQYVTTYVPPCSAKMAISRDCEIPDIAFLFMNYQNIDKWERIAYRWGVEGEDWVKADEDDYHPYESIGYKSDIVLINDIWAVPNNNIWAGSVEFPCIVTADQQLASPISENAPEFKYAESYLINEPYSIAFDDIPSNLSYTIEEYEEWSDLRTSLKSYVLEARTLFCMGEMDVDKDWESYIEELNNLRYKEILAVDQAAYDRMNRMND